MEFKYPMFWISVAHVFKNGPNSQTRNFPWLLPGCNSIDNLAGGETARRCRIFQEDERETQLAPKWVQYRSGNGVKHFSCVVLFFSSLKKKIAEAIISPPLWDYHPFWGADFRNFSSKGTMATLFVEKNHRLKGGFHKGICDRCQEGNCTTFANSTYPLGN